MVLLCETDEKCRRRGERIVRILSEIRQYSFILRCVLADRFGM